LLFHLAVLVTTQHTFALNQFLFHISIRFSALLSIGGTATIILCHPGQVFIISSGQNFISHSSNHVAHFFVISVIENNSSISAESHLSLKNGSKSLDSKLHHDKCAIACISICLSSHSLYHPFASANAKA
jgi:hypothetical protein